MELVQKFVFWGRGANVNNNAASSVGKEAKTYIYRVEAWNE